ncbi:Monooxygenase FAD-binding [Penicillium sp. IBT 16267x]|nr:Monooxygenase FAD-binding [Penicillium sp. IBT 16267x]
MAAPRAKLPLDVIVVGAGIGGMAAALTLGLRGHRVVVLEAAPKLMEVGAGIQVSPNMLRLFDRKKWCPHVLRESRSRRNLSWGISDLIHAKDVVLEHIHVRRWQDGSLLGTMPVNKTFGQQVVLHRADLHNALIAKALELDNVTLRENSAVTSVQFNPASVTLANGSIVRGDVVIGVDGIKSTVREHLLQDSSTKAIATGDAAYRIMLPRSVMEKDAELKTLVEEPQATRWLGPGRHIVGYPVRKHELYNVVLLHPDRQQVEESWTTKGSNPYVAQGAAQAVEDAAALGVVLSSITSHRDIPRALQVYEKSRKQRAETVQQSGSENRITLHLPDGRPATSNSKFFWGLDAEKAALDAWNELQDNVKLNANV